MLVTAGGLANSGQARPPNPVSPPKAAGPPPREFVRTPVKQMPDRAIRSPIRTLSKIRCRVLAHTKRRGEVEFRYAKMQRHA